MRILLTGSSGSIGRPLHRRLRRAGHDVIRLARVRDANYESGAILFEPADPDLFLLEGFDAVIHLAGAPVAKRWTPWRRRAIVSSRAGFTARLCEALAQTSRPPAHFLSASGIGYYGHRTAGELTEESPAGEGFLADVCQQWEGATAALAALPEATRPRIALMRIGAVLWPDGGAVAKLRTPFRFGLGARMGTGAQALSWISMPDAVEAIAHVLDTPALAGPVNLTAPAAVTNAQFTAALARALGKPAKLRLPAALLKLAYGRMAEETILADQRVAPVKLLASGFEFRHATLEAALGEML